MTDTPITMDELLPCPFCGGKATCSFVTGMAFDWWCQCQECHVSMRRRANDSSKSDPVRQMVVEDWNRRASPARSAEGMDDEDRTRMPPELNEKLWRMADETFHATALVANDLDCVKIIYSVLAARSATALKDSYSAIMDDIDYIMDSRGELHTAFTLVFSDEKAVHRISRKPSEARSSQTPARSAEGGKLFAWYWYDEHDCLYITGDDRKPDVPAEAKPLFTRPGTEAEAEAEAGEAVAWRVRVKSADPEEWELLPAGGGADYLKRDGYECQPLYTRDAPLDLAGDNDGKEQDAFERWAMGEGYDMHLHPLHWLFMEKTTAAARNGWRAGIRYARKRALEASNAV